MNILKAFACSAALALPALAMAVHPRQYPDTFLIPERAIILTGNRANAERLVAVLYNQEDMHFNEPNCPRFLFLDREGKIALGIGGYAKVSFQYDVRGSIDEGANFIPYNIPVPNRADQNSAFYANANHSSIFLQLVGRHEKIGTYQVYLLGDFTGNGYKGYGFRLKQAYMSAGFFTVGLANSTMMDASVGTPGIDNIGPSGETFRRNVLARFNPHFDSHWSAAISIENPPVSLTTDEYTKEISQRCPDIPAYVQYAWEGGKSHVRLSGLFRSLSYRNLVAEKNRSVIGWAAQLSGKLYVAPGWSLLYQGSYGRGYGSYTNDMATDLDLVHTEGGAMEAPRQYAFEVGTTFNLTKDIFLAGAYSKTRVLGTNYLGPDAYRGSDYISATAFYNIIPDMQIALGYLHGVRTDFNSERGRANRIAAMLKYSF